jgi:hypothetical protein
MENGTAGATASGSSTAYKAVPGRSTLAMSNGLERLFSTPPSSRAVSRENSGSSVPGQTREWEVSTTEKRCKARALEAVHRELDEYLNDPLETFSRTERTPDGIEQRVVFDLLAFWQVCAISLISCCQS